MCICGSLPDHDECSICRIPETVKAAADLSRPVMVPVPVGSAAGEEPF